MHFSVCSETILTSGNGTLTSPNYPNNYDNDLNCEVNITASADRVSLFKSAPMFEVNVVDTKK